MKRGCNFLSVRLVAGAVAIGVVLASPVLMRDKGLAQDKELAQYKGLAQADNKQTFPDVINVTVKPTGIDLFDFDVTMTSPYDTAQRYADAFRVAGADGKVFGERVLLHDHADEQPFTRDLSRVRIPVGVKVVIVQGRDQVSGYGGRAVTVTLPGR